MSSTEYVKENVYTDHDLARIMGILQTYVVGRKKITKKWVFNSIKKDHDVKDAVRILDVHKDHFISINEERYEELRELFSC